MLCPIKHRKQPSNVLWCVTLQQQATTRRQNIAKNPLNVWQAPSNMFPHIRNITVTLQKHVAVTSSHIYFEKTYVGLGTL